MFKTYRNSAPLSIIIKVERIFAADLTFPPCYVATCLLRFLFIFPHGCSLAIYFEMAS